MCKLINLFFSSSSCHLILKCSDCDYQTNREADLDNHVEATHGYNFECAICPKKFQSLQILNYHINKIHFASGKPFECDECDKSFTSEYKLFKHHKMHEKGSTYNTTIASTSKESIIACDLCGITIKACSMRNHIRNVHMKVAKFECDYCGKKCFKKSGLRYHIQRHIPMRYRERLHECGICLDRFFTKNCLQVHFKSKHTTLDDSEMASFICKCGKAYRSRGQLNQHFKMVHEKEKYRAPCQYCGKILSSSTHLKEHIRIFHTEGGQNNFICKICGKLYNLKRDLTTHEKSHGERNFVCQEPGCSKKFIFAKQLKEHFRSAHLNQKDHICSYENCDKRFTSRQKLIRHLMISHEKLRVFCPVGDGCKFAVGRRDYMNNHLKKHIELSPEEVEKHLEAVKHMKLV